jgi:alpha,alpha-trehalase
MALVGLPALSWGAGRDCTLMSQIRSYIQQDWTALRRTNGNAIRSVADSKVPGPTGIGKALLYLPRDMDPAPLRHQLQRALKAAEYARLDVRQLPEDFRSIEQEGLLYLPHPYIVPGGRFNEMYGWDSYFIVLGLARAGDWSLAKDMADNLIFEVEHYGKVLNANRTYYLERSQPPFLTETILEVFRHTGDVAWLRASLPAIEKYYGYWTTEPHLTPQTGLSRYDSSLDTPAPEVVYGERDAQDRNEYDRVREYYRAHLAEDPSLSRYYDAEHKQLTPLFYRGDRAMRESGFDISGRFGPFSADIIDYNPVDLNCLLYRMEMDIVDILTTLDQPREARVWMERAEHRAAAIHQLMWNETAGLYFDYNLEQKRQSGYRFITTFYPLWAGIASPEQAARVEANLPVFERNGGLVTSDHVTGDQWDAPFGWAPMQIIATEGLRRYGYSGDANRIAEKFLSMVLHDFARHRTIVEKYDVVAAKSDLASQELKFGYETDEVGFGWTNAAFLVLYDQLPETDKRRLCQE